MNESLININSAIMVIAGSIISLLLAMIGFFLRKVYSELIEWRKEVTGVLHLIDKRIYRLEILTPGIANQLIEPTFPNHNKE